jgi:cytidylate kinase
VIEAKKNHIIITIDGPTASGKSSVARMLAQRLDICHLNTGLLYRSIGYVLVTEYGYNEKKLEEPSRKDIESITKPGRLIYKYDSKNGIQILFDNVDITPYLKDRLVDTYASVVAKNKAVRVALLEYQRCLASKCSIVAEGRDMGSVVFPDARHKFYLTAPLAVRANRWRKLQKKRGNVFSAEEAEQIVNERDMRDKNRLLDPLIMSKDAQEIDTSDKTKDQVVEGIIQKIS